MNFFLFHLDYYYLILVVPAMILALIAQIGVKRAYAKYAQVRVTSGMTGADAAMNVLRHYGLMDVRIERIAGNLTDHYDPRANVIRLSDGVYGSASVAAIGVACHEAGHAVQHAKGYLPIKIRNAISSRLQPWLKAWYPARGSRLDLWRGFVGECGPTAIFSGCNFSACDAAGGV